MRIEGKSVLPKAVNQVLNRFLVSEAFAKLSPQAVEEALSIVVSMFEAMKANKNTFSTRISHELARKVQYLRDLVREKGKLDPNALETAKRIEAQFANRIVLPVA